jgi:hypothetical protein
MASREKTLIEVRILHAVFLMTVFLLAFTVQMFNRQEQPVSPVIPLAIACVAVSDIGIGFVMRKKLMDKATEVFASKEEGKGLQAWRFANIYSFAHAETVVLLGVTLKALGANWKVAAPFFAVGFALLVWWTPRMELTAPTNAAAPPRAMS